MSKIVLMYHDVYKQTDAESGFFSHSSSLYKISAECFECQVRVVSYYCKQHNLPLDFVEFTFDDGGESFYTTIAPILEKYGFKGIFFVSTAYVDTEKFLTREQIKQLSQRGHIVASHSHTHPKNMTKLSMEDLLKEWTISKQILESIVQSPITIASIPSGYNSMDVTISAMKAGIRTLYTSKPTTKLARAIDITLVGRYAVHCNTKISTIYKILSNDLYRKILLLKYKLISFSKIVLGKYYEKVKRYIISGVS